ncbi:MAG: hypothetical protein RR942_01465 [Romboutsia sp.]
MSKTNLLREDYDNEKLQYHRNNLKSFNEINFKRQISETFDKNLILDFEIFIGSNDLSPEQNTGAELFLKFLINKRN